MKSVYVFVLALALTIAISQAEAANLKMNFKNAEILDVIENYAKQTGEKFIVDPGVKGKISIFIQKPIPEKEAFARLSSALALNGYAISQQNGSFIVMSARNVQRNLIEVSEDLPSLSPERMAVWVYNFKHASAKDINREMRIFPSKDGEVAVQESANRLIFTDWTSNLHRISEMLSRLDKKPNTTK